MKWSRSLFTVACSSSMAFLLVFLRKRKRNNFIIKEKNHNFSIVVHGGAWAIPDKISEATLNGVKRAANIGYSILNSGGTALQAVEAAVRELELNPVFDAGVGSVLNNEGAVEMDAMIMCGKTLSTGAVAGISNVRHPVTVARLVKEKTDHVIFVGSGADQLAKELGVETVDQSVLVTPAARIEWETFNKYKASVGALFDNSTSVGHDTVGAVAMDNFGHLACATSTGGITAKKKGRVGDSPFVGCGGYAQDGAGAVSTTGHGESIIKVVLAHRIIENLSSNDPNPNPEIVQSVIQKNLEYMKSKVSGYGGAIAIDRNGFVGISHTTKRKILYLTRKKIKKIFFHNTDGLGKSRKSNGWKSKRRFEY